MKNVLFDEKMYGTVHLAVGASYEFAGGKNVSAVHWDMVKDLRRGGEIHLDGDSSSATASGPSSGLLTFVTLSSHFRARG